MVSAREVRELLDERPDLEPAVEAALAAEPPWDFHDVGVDSGRFGELVARGVVEQTDDGYRVPDSEAVERGLRGEIATDSTDADGFPLPELAIPITRRELGLIAGAILLVVALRLFSLPNVYYRGHVVLSGNDPYLYRYVVDQLLLEPAVTPSELPGGMSHGEPLLVVILWLATLALGGTPAVAGHVLAWYPVATAALTALLVYATAVLVTDDRRIGLAAVAMFAVLPGHAMRTSLGFADHHPFDYLWLAVTLFGVVAIARAAHRREALIHPLTVTGVAAIAFGVAGQTLAWEAGPLVSAALVPYLGAELLRANRRRDDPVRSLGPLTAGLALAAGTVWLAHTSLGWHSTPVATAPVLMAVGAAALLAIGAVTHRFPIPTVALAGVELLLAGAAVVVLRARFPEFWALLMRRAEGSLFNPRPIAEVQTIFGDSLGWLLLFGFVLIIALPYLAWATRRAIDDARWLPVVVATWYFLGLSTVQARFVGELSPVLAVVAGLGLVHLAHLVDLARPPAPFADIDPPELSLPDARQAGQLLVLFLLVAGLSVVQVPVMTSKITPSSGIPDAAFAMAADSDDHGLEYPRNYVLSEWSWNRVYNYFVNGESRSYGYARETYPRFIGALDYAGWYDRYHGRVGFVVTPPLDALEPTQLGAVLHRDAGSRTDAHAGVGHYRLVAVGADGRYKAFALVPGAVLRGTTEPNAAVTASTTLDVPGGTSPYRRRTTADASGNFSLRVANPGRYRVANATVTVPEDAVLNGSTVRVPPA